MTLQIVQDEAADEVLSSNSFALLCGMVLQEQVPVDVAFSGPAKILDRFGSLDPASIEEAAPEEFAELCAAEPPIHPYPDSMSVLIQAAARFVVVNYAGNAATLWETAGSGEHLLSRLMLLPGFSKRKAQMFIALLGKQMGVRPLGWEQAAGPFAQPDVHRSVADVRDPESLEKVRSGKSRRSQGKKQSAGQNKATRSSHLKESKGSRIVTTEEENAETAERTGARKARKAAKRAANRAAKEGAAGEVSVDPESGEAATKGARKGGAKRAAVKARKAAKRSARRAAQGLDPDAPAKKGGGGRPGGGRAGKKAAAGRNARKRAAAPEGSAEQTAADGTLPEISAEGEASTSPDAGQTVETSQGEPGQG